MKTSPEIRLAPPPVQRLAVPTIAPEERRLARKAFTLVELLVVIAIIAILAALLLPAVSTVKARGQEADCSSNLRQIGIAIASHVFDYRFYPPKPVGNYNGSQTNALAALDSYMPTNSLAWFCKRQLQLDRTTPDALRASGQISYWNWMYNTANTSPLSESATSNAWSTLVNTNAMKSGLVLMSDRFRANNSSPYVQVHGRKTSSPLNQPGTLVLITGGTVTKIAPLSAPN